MSTKSYSRRRFLKQGSLLAALVVVPRKLLAESGQFAMNEFAIIDLHCHPSMKMWLWGKKFWKAHLSVGKGGNLFPMQENNHQFRFGNVRGIFATHYLLEAGTQTEWNLLKVFYPILKWIPFVNVNRKIETEGSLNFKQVGDMISMLNDQLNTTNGMQKDLQYCVVTNYIDFKAVIDAPAQDMIAVAHTIEGGHALGRGLPISKEGRAELKKSPARHPQLRPKAGEYPWQPYIDNLNAFADRGVALITLSHFFFNDLTRPVDGISPDTKKHQV